MSEPTLPKQNRIVSTAVGNMLDRRYEDFVSGSVEGIPGDQAFAEITRKSAARRAMPRP